MKNFGKFQVANLSEDIVSSDKLVISMLSDIQNELADVRRTVYKESKRRVGPPLSTLMRRAARMWMKDKSCDVTDLISNDDFYTFAEEEINAPRHFSDRDDFIHALEKQLRALAA